MPESGSDNEALEAGRKATADRFSWALVAVLRGGAIGAAALLAAGLLAYFHSGIRLPLDAGAHEPVTMPGFAWRLLAGDPIALLDAGILVLIALPIARVILSLFHFLDERDRLYVFLTSAVLAILFTGILLGKTL